MLRILEATLHSRRRHQHANGMVMPELGGGVTWVLFSVSAAQSGVRVGHKQHSFYSEHLVLVQMGCIYLTRAVATGQAELQLVRAGKDIGRVIAQTVPFRSLGGTSP
jgi:hypothetical protein